MCLFLCLCKPRSIPFCSPPTPIPFTVTAYVIEAGVLLFYLFKYPMETFRYLVIIVLKLNKRSENGSLFSVCFGCLRNRHCSDGTKWRWGFEFNGFKAFHSLSQGCFHDKNQLVAPMSAVKSWLAFKNSYSKKKVSHTHTHTHTHGRARARARIKKT